MPWARFAFLFAVLSSLLGCGAIYTAEPFGSDTVFPPGIVDGLWLGPETVIGVKVIDAENGVVTTWLAARYSGRNAAFKKLRCEPPVASEPSCSFENWLGTCFGQSECHDPAVGTCTWRHFDNVLFPMIKNLKKDAYETRFGLVMDKKGVSAFVIYVPAEGLPAERMWNLIGEGRVPSRIDEDGTPILGPLTEEHYRAIVEWNRGPFQLNGITFIKLPDELNPCMKHGGQ
jgi:hypothetical protein